MDAFSLEACVMRFSFYLMLRFLSAGKESTDIARIKGRLNFFCLVFLTPIFLTFVLVDQSRAHGIFVSVHDNSQYLEWNEN
jgi:hypothetical protein